MGPGIHAVAAARVWLRRTRFTGHVVGERGDHAIAVWRRRVLAGLGGGAVAVAFEQPVLVVVRGEAADAGAELLEGVEALDPEHLFLEGLDELLDAAVGLGLVVVGRVRAMPRWSISAW